MGLMDISPHTRILANDDDITAIIAQRFKGLRLTDATGLESDTLEISLADHDRANPIKKPSTGAEIELFLGYDGQATRMGLFVCDEVETGGWPRYMTIRARAAVYEGSSKGKKDLQSQKTRAWPKDTTIGAMVAKIAKEHGLTPAVAKSLASIKLPALEQTEESDISFLLRALKAYGVIVKPAGGKLVVAKRGESKSIDGEALPSVTIRPEGCGDWTCRLSRKEGKGTVVAYYRSVGMAKRMEVSVGKGDPVKRLRHPYTDKAAAEAAAKSELEKRERGQETFSATVIGRPDLSAEGRLIVQGFGDGEDGEWLLSKVEHIVDDGGYSCRIEAEKPNASAGA